MAKRTCIVTDCVNVASASCCAVDGCDRSARKRGFCGAHYQRYMSGRSMTTPLLLRHVAQKDRLLRHVSFVSETGCWEWTGGRTKDGYGVVSIGGHKGIAAHRSMYIETVGPIPDGMEIDHLCRNRGCVNPAHLEIVTRTENIRRALPWNPNRLKTQCAHGHPYDAENTYFAKNGARVCRACRRKTTREWMRARRIKRKAAAEPPTSRPTHDVEPTT